MRNFLALLILSTLLCACDKDKDYDRTKAISAFVAVDPIRVDEALQTVDVKIPTAENLTFWSGSSALQNQKVENFKIDYTLVERGFFKKYHQISLDSSSKFWLFYAGSKSDHFVFSPIIKDGKVFIFDTAGVLSAVDLASEKKLWKSQVFKKSFLKNYQTPKIGYGDGKIIAIGGVNQIAAASEVDGSILWSKEISSIPVSNPVADEKLVYVTTNNNKLYAFDLGSGELTWVHSGVARNAAIFGSADPVIYKDFLIVSYSSGEIYALNKKTGEALWSQDLNLNKATNSDFYLNDVDATPLVKNGVVYTIGNGGLMMAIDLKSGNYSWRKQIAGITDFWAADDFLFVINNDNKLLAVSKKTGGIKWISQLPNLEKDNKPQTKFIYSGLVMAGDKLVISRSDGQILIASPINGDIEKTFEVDKRISHAPIVIDGKIYLHTIGKWTIDLIEIQ
jgi:outer membrane protein assembly factor BamB